MKRIILSIVLTLGVATISASALGIGGSFNIGLLSGMPNSARLTLKLDNVAPVLGIGVSVGSTNAAVSATADWWLYKGTLSGPLSLYAGLGGYAELQTGTSTNFGVGARIPVGIRIFPLKPLELFLELAPSAGLTLNTLHFPVWGMQAAAGFRFWF